MAPSETMAKTTCVIGHPVGHSLSPAMHNAAFAALGMPHVYTAYDVLPENVLDAVRGAQALGFLGMNVTIPHKGAVIPALSCLTPRAAALQSVNTISFASSGPEGDSTDGPGFIAALAAEGYSPDGAQVVMLGSGGSARAIAHALHAAGCSITVAGRTPQRVQQVIDVVRSVDPDAPICGAELTPRALEALLPSADLLVNTTPLGMHPDTDAMPPLPLHALRPTTVVCDIIFNPVCTRFLGAARSVGCLCIDGRGMLVHQGALAFEIWTGVKPPISAMRAALDRGLGVL